MDVWLWVGFTSFILLMLGLDLGLLQRRPHVIGMKEAMAWFAAWTALALLFNVGVFFFHERGAEAGLEFFAGFLVEKSLSIDNVFVFILIFNYFHVPPAYHHKVLFWGIIGAIVLRIVFIIGGVALMERFHWSIYLFGAFLVATGIGMMRKKETHIAPEHNWVIRTFRRFFPVSERYENSRFFVWKDGRMWATPLFIVLLAIESSDIVFAADSIPAIFAITPDPFIVYTSNIFAMLGLRALYFAVSGFMQTFHLLHYGFASIITILGIKMLLSDVYKVPLSLSLALIVVILLMCVIVSLLRPRMADLKPMFERTERLGLIPFRRLLLIENVLDLGALKVRDAMCARSQVRCLGLDVPWEDNLMMMRTARLSRYPLVSGDSALPLGIVHVKDIMLRETSQPMTADQLKQLARPCRTVNEDLPLEEALLRFQRRYDQMGVVFNGQGEWTGIITIEDVLEEIVGRIGDEFDQARTGRSVSLADALSQGRIVLGLRAGSMREAIDEIIAHIPRGELPADPKIIAQIVLEREKAMPTYLGKGLAVPHGRFEHLDRPILAFARSDEGIPIEGSNERAELIFMLLTPSSMVRLQPRLLADIVDLFDSEYVTERLHKADTAEEVIEAIRDGQDVAVD